MIRADLVFRQYPDSPAFCPGECTPVTLESIQRMGEDEVPSLLCRIVSVPSPLIGTAQTPPLHYRLRIFCAQKGGPVFPLTFLGVYALNLAALEPFEGEELLFTRGLVCRRRGGVKSKESAYEVFVGGPENSETSCVELRTPPGLSRPKDKRGTTEDIMFNPRPTRKKYVGLQDVQLDNREYNVWGVVTKIKREPSPTSRQFIKATVYIMDEHYQGSINFPDFQFSILSKDVNDFLPLRPGSIIRIHNMRKRKWSGALTGCVYDAKLITLVKMNEEGFPTPVFKSKNFIWTEEDKKRSRELHQWWVETLQPNERENILSNALEVRAVKGYCRFDLYCVVLNKFMIDEDDFVLNVSDGTQSPILSESFVIEDNSFRPQEGKYEVDIFFSGQEGLYHSLSVGDCILLMQILCRADKELVDKTVYKFSVGRNSHSNCRKLELHHPVSIDIKKRIESLSTKDVDVEEYDSEYFSQRSVRAGHRLDQLKLRSQKSYVETASTSTTSKKRRHPEDDEDILSSSVDSTVEEDESKLSQCLKSVFNSLREEEDSGQDRTKSITEIPDIPRLLKQGSKSGHFLTRGLIKAIYPLNPLQMVITICSKCRNASPIQSLEEVGSCGNCGERLLISFNFQLVLQKDFDFIDVFVSGCNAELFLGIAATDFLTDRRAQGEIFHKFRHFVINQMVELNIVFYRSKGLVEYYSMGKPRFLGNV